MDTPRDHSQFALSQESFGVKLLRQAKQRASELPAALEGQYPDATISEAANEAFARLLEHVSALPEDKRVGALLMVASGMIVEHLRLASWTRRA
ncbi:MAG: hypothetical protein H6Q86_2465 [candidate division NC10 bacterium]|jgi:hypothetical protein|nr:hypothetical protein [candidate division NC10 bacterium]